MGESTLMWAQLLTTILGAALTLSPYLFGFPEPAADVCHVIGPLVVSVGLMSCWQVLRALRLLQLPLAAILAAAPWIFTYQDHRAALLISLLAALSIAALSFVRGRLNERYDGGWRMILQGSDAS